MIYKRVMHHAHDVSQANIASAKCDVGELQPKALWRGTFMGLTDALRWRILWRKGKRRVAGDSQPWRRRRVLVQTFCEPFKTLYTLSWRLIQTQSKKYVIQIHAVMGKYLPRPVWERSNLRFATCKTLQRAISTITTVSFPYVPSNDTHNLLSRDFYAFNYAWEARKGHHVRERRSSLP